MEYGSFRVFDKELGRFFDEWPADSLISKVFKLKNSPEFERKALENDPEYEEAKTELGRFLFLTQDQEEQLLTQQLMLSNPNVDSAKMQTYYGFDQQPFDAEKLDFRVRGLLTEEFNETIAALDAKDAEELVDGLIDLVVIAIGTLQLAGVSFDKAWKEVYRANMSKVRGVKPGREQSGGFDLMKPEGWTAPDHSDNHGVLPEIFKGE